MVSAIANKEKKLKMIEKTKRYFEAYKNYMVLNVHKVTSNQIKNFGSFLPREFKSLFVKNKIIKKVLREIDEKKYGKLIDTIKGNVFIGFFDGIDPRLVLDAYNANLRNTFAMPGDIAYEDIVLPAGPTVAGPETIVYFQSAGINTKIFKGNILIVNDHVLVPKGRAIGISEAKLLKMLGIAPFMFGLEIIKIFEADDVYDKNVLLIDEATIENEISQQIDRIAKLSLGSGIVTEASLSYEMAKAYSDIQKLALGLSMPFN